jgi:hypothetical protein
LTASVPQLASEVNRPCLGSRHTRQSNNGTKSRRLPVATIEPLRVCADAHAIVNWSGQIRPKQRKERMQ